jgi:hypothetical protein
MHGLKPKPENAAQPESDLSSVTERDPEVAGGSIPGDKPGVFIRLEDSGPPRWRRRRMVGRPGCLVLLLLQHGLGQ